MDGKDKDAAAAAVKEPTTLLRPTYHDERPEHHQVGPSRRGPDPSRARHARHARVPRRSPPPPTSLLSCLPSLPDAKNANGVKVKQDGETELDSGGDKGGVQGRKGGELRVWGGELLPMVKVEKPGRDAGGGARDPATSNVRDGGGERERERDRNRLGRSRANSRAGRVRADSHAHSAHGRTDSNAHNRTESSTQSSSDANTNPGLRAPFESASSTGTEKGDKDKDRGKVGTEKKLPADKRSKENTRHIKEEQKQLEGISEGEAEVEVEVDDPLDDGRGLLSAGWGAGHAGSAFEVLGVWIGEKNTAHNLTRPNRTQRLAEYAARRADLGLCPASSSTTKTTTRTRPRAPSPFPALSSRGYGYAEFSSSNAKAPATTPGCARPLCPARRPSSLAGRKRRMRPWEEHYPPVSRGAGPNSNGSVLGAVWEVPEEGDEDGMDIDKEGCGEPAEDQGRRCACRKLAAADRGAMKGRTVVCRFGSGAGSSLGFKYDPDVLRSVLFPPPPDPIPVVVVEEPMEVDGEGDGDAAGPVEEDRDSDAEDKEGDDEPGRARKRRRVSGLEDVFAAAAMELGEVAGVGDRDALEEPKEKEKEFPAVEVEREEGEVDPEPEGEKMQEDGEVVVEEKGILREKTPAKVEPVEENANEVVEEKEEENTEKRQVELVTKDGVYVVAPAALPSPVSSSPVDDETKDEARWSVTPVPPMATSLGPLNIPQ
ncbi:hypothetical protein C8F04DRAFT_729602 [Mycena alexandri]|uniref:Uncharacterized protein n=1 Tax=Mycena alexandri TaxID=1745969 RepID=A0AAD6TCA3_9AGAR|nr:hypothetical protein C8F04DRAFT_729602 [Mycena alexandri]